MVTLENQKGEKFIVGSDCANTLTIDKSQMFFEVEPAFNEGKFLRAKIIKHFKNNTIQHAYIYNSSKDSKQYIVLQAKSGASSMQQIFHPSITVPYIKNLLTK